MSQPQIHIDEGFDLSPQQRRLWLLSQRAGVAGLARARVSFRVSGELNLKTLRDACEQVVARHDQLRTSFYRPAGMRLPLQVVSPIGIVQWNDAQGANSDDAPGLIASVVRLAPDQHEVELSVSPFCADAASLRNIVNDVAAFYEAITTGASSPGETASYIQFSEWQNELSQAEDRNTAAGRAFWRAQNLSSLPDLILPFALAHCTADVFDTNSVTVKLEPELLVQIDQRAQQFDSTVADYLFACWAVLLWRLSNCAGPAIAERIDGRKYADLEDAVGLLEKWLPVRFNVAAATQFSKLLASLQDTRRERRAWEDCFWGTEKATTENSAISAIGFEYELPHRELIAADLKFSEIRILGAAEPFKLKLSCRQVGDEMSLALHFAAGLHQVDDMQRMASSLRTLIESTLSTPDLKPGRLEILDLAAREQLVKEFNQTLHWFGPVRLIHELIAEQAQRTPDAVALIYEDKKLSYGELNKRANQLAKRLRTLGIGPDVIVAILLERSVETCVALLATMKAGGAYLPIDNRFPRQRIAFMLEDSQAPVLLTEQEMLENLPEYSGHMICLDSDWREITSVESEPPVANAGEDNLAYVIFTSGSTGRPKGVAIEHRQLFNYVNGVRQRLGLDECKSFAMVSTFAADLGSTALYPALCSGATLHIIPRDIAADAEALADYFSNNPVDCLKIVPSHFEALLTAPAPERIVPLQRLVLGGELARCELAERARELAASCDVFNHYGPTETTVGVLTFDSSETGDVGSTDALPLGRPLANSQVHILDSELRLAPLNVPAELYIGGAGLARGYLGRPEQTAARFVPDPFAETGGARLYRTGDRGRRLVSGVVEFLGRTDEQVKFHGHRVELGELRAALNRHARVRDSVVMLRADGAGRPLLAAYYVARQELEAGELRQFMLGEVVGEVVPQVFVHLKRLPLTLNGKVNYEALPEPVLTRTGAGYAGPRTPVEELVAGVWSEVLGVERIGIRDNFFELGGHSLLATQVVSRLRAACGVELPLRILFEAPTVAGLTNWITTALNSRQAQAAPPLMRIERGAAPLPLSFAQQRLWFLYQLDPESAAYNVFGSVRFAGKLDVDALQRSLREVVRRHEALRTSFPAVDGVPRQAIHQTPDIRLEVEQVAGEMEARRLAVSEGETPFDLEHGPLFRVRLVRLNENDHLVFYTMHHVISDAWSMTVLFKEVTALYGAFSRGSVSPLSDLPIQYADYAVWQREWLQGEVLAEQLSYWWRQLAGAPALIALPTDRPRPAVRSYRGAAETAQYPTDLLNSIKKLSRHENVTPFMTLLAGFATLLSRRTGQVDLVLGTDVANRMNAEVEQLIGFFINQLALRVDLAGDPTFLELVRRVREVCLGAYAHQDVPFDRVVAEITGERSAGQTPLFQVLFVVQHAPRETTRLADVSVTPITYEGSASKFDLGVFITETDHGLEGVWRYSTDLFEAETVRGLARQYETLLRSALDQIEERISRLELLSEEEKARQKEAKQRSEQEKLARLKNRRRDVVALNGFGLVKAEPVDEGDELPLLVSPRVEGIDLAEWVSGERVELERLLLKHGALLFRGFNVRAPEEFERVASALCPELFDEYGDLPRSEVSGKVYGSTPYPADQSILFHNESSHLDRWPMKIWFCCMKAARQGGETPIVDCRKIYSLLDQEIKEEFERKQLMYVRNYTPGLDVSWQQFFRTESRRTVEEICRQASVECEWTEGGGLRTRKRRPAVVRHPRTGELTFFNQLQLHHVSCLVSPLRESVHTMFAEADLPRSVYFADGSRIEDSVIDKIRAVFQQAARAIPWHEGDILMLDNMLTAHARNPYVGERQIMVAMGEMMSEREVHEK